MTEATHRGYHVDARGRKIPNPIARDEPQPPCRQLVHHWLPSADEICGHCVSPELPHARCALNKGHKGDCQTKGGCKGEYDWPTNPGHATCGPK